MQPTLCSRCKKNVAVVFVQRMENGETKNEGLCLSCAKELGINPVDDDLLKKMGLSADDVQSLTEEMMSAMGGEGMDPPEEGGEEDEDEGKTATFPFLNKLFGGSSAPTPEKEPAGGEKPAGDAAAPKGGEKSGKGKENGKRKFLENYCISLTNKAAQGKLDNIIGRDEEIARTIQILNRRQKNNPCLIGEPGVGKTAIAEIGRAHV